MVKIELTKEEAQLIRVHVLSFAQHLDEHSDEWLEILRKIDDAERHTK